MKSPMENTFQILSYEELLSHLDVSRHLDGSYEGCKVKFYAGDVKIDSDLNLDAVRLAEKIAGIAIQGNLTVGGSIVNAEGDFGPFLVVQGDVQAQKLVAGGSEISLLGTTTIAQVVVARYNHGALNLEKLVVPLCISDDHSTNISDKSGIGIYIGNQFEPVDARGILHPEVLVIEDEDDDYYYIDAELLVERVLNGKPVMDPTHPLAERLN